MTRRNSRVPGGRRPPGLFITGTNTGVGKTWVGAAIARAVVAGGYRVGVYKPALSGFVTELDIASAELLEASPDDDVVLWRAAGRPATLARVCPQRFRAAVAPPLAARAEGRTVDPQQLRMGLDYWRENSDFVLIEGAGGLMSPVTDEDYVADLAYEFGYPLLVVARNELGVINQTLQTLIAAATFRDGIAIAGIVLNAAGPRGGPHDPSLANNRCELEKRATPPVLAELDWHATSFPTPIDWLAIAENRPAGWRS